jgi:hypothetical protein
LPEKRVSSVILLAIPLIISAFTHIWNPIGFPAFFVDEGHYMRRAMQVLQGLGPQESSSVYPYPYDHPYFGQLFLSGLLWVTGFPQSANVSDGLELKKSIEVLHEFPRIIMGVLAVIDTFLIFKIAQLFYNRKVAFISATLFAVMPITMMFRMILLDNLLMPLLLLSILSILYYRGVVSKNSNSVSSPETKGLILVIFSGISFGIGVFTKETIVFMIPLLCYLILTSTKKGQSRKLLLIWFIPVAFFLFLWPAVTLAQNQFDEWLDGILYQTVREEENLSSSVQSIFNIDPILMGLTIAGFIFARKRDYMTLFWIIPYLILIAMLGAHIRNFHFIPVIPAFCILSANLLVDLIQSMHKKMILGYIICSSIVVFGIISTTLLVSTDLTSTYFDLYAYLVKSLPASNNKVDSTVTMIGPHWTRSFFWIPKYIFNKDLIFKDYDPTIFLKGTPVSEKVIFLATPTLENKIRDKKLDDEYMNQIRLINSRTIAVGTFIENWTALGYPLYYPYSSFDSLVGHLNKIDVRAN